MSGEVLLVHILSDFVMRLSSPSNNESHYKNQQASQVCRYYYLRGKPCSKLVSDLYSVSWGYVHCMLQLTMLIYWSWPAPPVQLFPNCCKYCNSSCQLWAISAKISNKWLAKIYQLFSLFFVELFWYSDMSMIMLYFCRIKASAWLPWLCCWYCLDKERFL